MIHRIHFTIRFAIYIIIFMMLYFIAAVTGFKYSNCWIYAIERYLSEGGYIVFRKTFFNQSSIIWEHALWSRDLKTFYSFVPKDTKVKRLFPPIIFIGREIITDRLENVIC